MATPAEFDEIRPYEAGEMQQAFHDLLNDRQFSLEEEEVLPFQEEWHQVYRLQGS